MEFHIERTVLDLFGMSDDCDVCQGGGQGLGESQFSWHSQGSFCQNFTKGVYERIGVAGGFGGTIPEVDTRGGMNFWQEPELWTVEDEETQVSSAPVAPVA